jgi:hypothetical protein
MPKPPPEPPPPSTTDALLTQILAVLNEIKADVDKIAKWIPGS